MDLYNNMHKPTLILWPKDPNRNQSHIGAIAWGLPCEVANLAPTLEPCTRPAAFPMDGIGQIVLHIDLGMVVVVFLLHPQGPTRLAILQALKATFDGLSPPCLRIW